MEKTSSTKRQKTENRTTDDRFYYQKENEELANGSESERNFLRFRNAHEKEKEFSQAVTKYEKYRNEYITALKDMLFILFFVDGEYSSDHFNIKGEKTNVQGGKHLPLHFPEPEYGSELDYLLGGPGDQKLYTSDSEAEDPDYDLPHLSGQMAYERWKSLSDREKEKYRNLILELIKTGEKYGWEFNTVEALRMYIKKTIGISKDYVIMNENKTIKISIETLDPNLPLLNFLSPGKIYYIVKSK